MNKGFLKKIPDSAEAALVLEGKLPGIIIFISIIIIIIIIILSLKASFPACSNLSPSSSAWKRQLCFQLCLRLMFLQGLESLSFLCECYSYHGSSSSWSLRFSTLVMFRFLYILISPTDSQRAGGCSDTGRAMGTAFSDRWSFSDIKKHKDRRVSSD